MSFADRIRARVKNPEQRGVSSMQEGLVYGMYNIMKNFGAYKHQDFLHPDFTSGQFFLLTDLIAEEAKRNKAESEKRQRESERKR